MKNRNQHQGYTTSSAPRRGSLSLFQEARLLYRQQVAYAVENIRQSNAAGGGKKPAWLRALNVIGAVAVAVTVLVLVIGLVNWPDAPVRETATGFVGKTGAPHTREDYEMFKLWKQTLLVVAPFTFIVNIGAACVTKRRRERQIERRFN